MSFEEHAEHAEHAHEHGNKNAALLIAVLAAMLAISEQQAKRADIAVEENAVSVADTWNEYQAKSIRSAVAHDLEQLTASLDVSADPARAKLRAEYLKRLAADQIHYDKDPENGKVKLAARARQFQTARQDSLERSHTYDNASAALELGIVLSTASVITSSKFLLRFGLVMGAFGLVLALFGAIAPALVVF